MRNGSGLTKRINGFLVDFDNETVCDPAGGTIKLRPQAFAVLRLLVENAGRVVTKNELMAAVWPDVAVTDDSLVQCTHEIRRALRDDAHAVLKTVPRRGYRLALSETDGEARRTTSRRVRWLGVAALTVVAVAVGWLWSARQADRSQPGVSVAVLPFDDFSGDARQARFAAAFTEDIITELARTDSLKVIARNSVEAYGDKPVDVRKIAADLGVRYVLEGGLELRPGGMRVTAQLIDARTGAHAWSERYDRPADDLFAVRDEILTRLVGTLTGYDGPFWTNWIAAAKRRPPETLQAFDYMLLAQEPYRRHDSAGVAESRHLLEKALELDPRLAGAWNALANAHMQEAINGWSGDRARSWELYREATRRAAELDPADGQIQLSLGVMHFEKGEVQLGAAAWARALELAPNDALVNRAIGTQLAIALGTERAAEGVALVERALHELDPLHPPFQWVSLGYALYFAGRYSEAVDALRKVPDPWLEPRVLLALASAEAGEAEQARRETAEVLRLDPTFSAEAWIANDFYQPGGSSARMFAASARKAGLPLCATNAEGIAPRERLPECEAGRASALNR